MKTDTTRQLSLRRTLLFSAIGLVLAIALAAEYLTRAGLATLDHLHHCFTKRKGSSC